MNQKPVREKKLKWEICLRQRLFQVKVRHALNSKPMGERNQEPFRDL